MKKNFRVKIREFVQSEEGKVGIKSPLTLGIATGSVLLAQAIIGTPDAAAGLCDEPDDCMGAKGMSWSLYRWVGYLLLIMSI